MAVPTNSRESDMATEDFYLSLSPLLSPRWSPPRPFLPSSSSMVMQYQGSNQSMDNPPQNQEHDDIVDPAPYLAGDSALLWLQQRLRRNWIEASDWRPLPTNFPLYRPMPSVFFVSSEQENIILALSCQHILEDKSGALHVNNEVVSKDILTLLFLDFKSYLNSKFRDLDQIARAVGMVPEDVESLVDNILELENYDESEVTLRRITLFEQDDEDIVDQPVFEHVGVVPQLIQNKGGWLDVIFREGVFMVNGQEIRDHQGLLTIPETLIICQAKLSFRVWLGHEGQWAAEIRCKCNCFNNGNFTTVEDAISAYEKVARWSGWMDLTGFPRLFENENRSKLPLQLPLIAQELNPVEAVGTGSAGTRDCIMANQARLNSACLGKRKTKEKNPGGERRSKKTNGVRIAIPLEDILQTKGMSIKEAANHLGVSQSALKYACREHGIPRWPPRKLITQSHPNETPTLVDQEGIPQSNSDTFPSDQALAATVEKITSVIVKEIMPPPFSPTARQERVDEDFGNVEAGAVGIGSGGTGQSEMDEGQLNSRYLGKEKRKETTPRGERRNKETSGVRIAISLEEILQTKEMPLKDAAKHLKVSITKLKSSCREYGIQRWPPRNEHKLTRQSLPNATPVVVDQEGSPHLTSDTVQSNQALTATVDTNNFSEKEILLPQLLPIAQQENPDVGFGNDEDEAIGMGVAGTKKGALVEAQLYSRCSEKKGKRKVNTPRGERGNNITTGVRIAITMEDLLKVKGMPLNVAAEHLEVSRSTLKRACREYGIKRWPPRKEHELISQTHPDEFPTVEHELISQTHPNESPAIEHELISQTHKNKSLVVVVDQEQTPQLNPDTFLPSNQVSTTIDTKSVKLKARYEGSTITFRLSRPLRKVELEQEVKKRLQLEAETYNISYKDEDDDLVLIACDDDLQECISSSTPLGSRCHELFLKPK